MNKVTALCIGDVHIKKDNIIETKDYIDKIQNFLKDANDIDIVIVMGDVLHTHESLWTIALNMALEFFVMLSKLKPTYVLVGNHDLINNSQFLTTNHWMNVFKVYDNLTIVDNVLIVEKNNVKFTMCPFVKDGRFLEALNTQKGKWEDSVTVFAHVAIDGAKMGATIIKDIEKWNENLPFLVSGHIHDKQKVQQNLYYTGSSRQIAFGESVEKTLYKLTMFEDKTYEESEIDLKMPRKRILHIDLDELEEFDVSSLECDEITEYKLKVDCGYEEFQAFKKTQKYKELNKKFKIVHDPKKKFVIEKNQQIQNDIKENVEKQRKFGEILEELVLQEENIFLNDLLYSIVFNQTRNNDFILIDEE